jgi:hypothetical protein
MKIVFGLLVALLSAGALAQGFGGQPGMFGPQFPQVLGANFVPGPGAGNNAAPRLGPGPGPAQQFPGCSDIQSVGSPILLVFQAQQLIENAMKLQN